jgi:hypothetical protein
LYLYGNQMLQEDEDRRHDNSSCNEEQVVKSSHLRIIFKSCVQEAMLLLNMRQVKNMS